MRFLISFLLAVAVLTAAPVRVLQVEMPEWGRSFADPSAAPGVAVSVYKSTPDADGYSGHATEVLRRLTGQVAGIASPIVEVRGMRAWDYLELELGKRNLDLIADYPAAPACEVEVHPYGQDVPVEYGTWLSRLETRALRDNVVIVVALPNAAQGRVGFLPLARNVIIAGSNTGAHVQDGYEPYTVAGNHTFTSYSAPDVALACALIVSEYRDKNLPYNIGTIRYWLTQCSALNAHGIREIDLASVQTKVRSLLAVMPAREPVASPVQPAVLPLPKPPGLIYPSRTLGSYLMRAERPAVFQIAAPGRFIPATVFHDKSTNTTTLAPTP